MTDEHDEFLPHWHAAAAGDAVLARLAAPARVAFAFGSGGRLARFGFGVAPDEPPAFTLHAPPEAWVKALRPVPERHHQGLFAMRMRVPGFAVSGEEIAFAQHCHLAR
ncbi:MAG: hypothetical protein K2X74_23185, partial [Acetobacteraceae bacterium]|nr:hypothetical protein [Acetobacteraceae bacterium]